MSPPCRAENLRRIVMSVDFGHGSAVLRKQVWRALVQAVASVLFGTARSHVGKALLRGPSRAPRVRRGFLPRSDEAAVRVETITRVGCAVASSPDLVACAYSNTMHCSALLCATAAFASVEDWLGYRTNEEQSRGPGCEPGSEGKLCRGTSRARSPARPLL